MNSNEINSNVDMPNMERKFVKIYKKLPHLWNPNHPDYNNRHKRNAGYDALLPIFRTYMPKATRLHVRQKINILRSCYRKELRKFLASSSIDVDGKVVYSYVPTNWKFSILRFLDCDENVENENDDSSAMDNNHEYDDDQELEYLQETEMESGNEEPDTSKIDVSPLYVEEDKPQPMKRKWGITNQTFTSESDVLEREYKAVGANVACKLQRMKAQQRYHAELLINKVLIKGLKEQLTEEMDLTDSWHVEQESVNCSSGIGDAKVEATDEQNNL